MSASLPVVQEGIQRVFDQASTYYRALRWEKNRLTRFEKELTRACLEDALGSQELDSIVEIGCGPGTWTEVLIRHARRVMAIDLSPGMLEQAREAVGNADVEFVNADASTFSTDRQFDAAVSVRVLEYVPEWRQVVRNVGAMVRPGGQVVLITKTRFSVWRGTGRKRWFIAYPRRLAGRLIYGRRPADFWQRHIGVRAMERELRAAGYDNIHVRPAIFGLPIYMRGTEQYALVPPFAEPPVIRAAAGAWAWVSRRGERIRRASLLFSESYVIWGTRLPGSP